MINSLLNSLIDSLDTLWTLLMPWDTTLFSALQLSKMTLNQALQILYSTTTNDNDIPKESKSHLAIHLRLVLVFKNRVIRSVILNGYSKETLKPTGKDPKES